MDRLYRKEGLFGCSKNIAAGARCASENLRISTTNEAISIASLTLTGDVLLSTNRGNISFDALKVGKEISLDVKNGNISGVISGSYDEYAIFCSIKKRKSNLPSKKIWAIKSCRLPRITKM